jgi:single-stranded DNA-binding protein
MSYCVTIAVIIYAVHTRKAEDNEKAVRFITFDVFSFVQPTRYSQNMLFFSCVFYRALVNIVMNHRVAKGVGNFLTGRRVFSSV